MSEYRKADKQVVDVIKDQMDKMIKHSVVTALTGHPPAEFSRDKIIEIACELYENKDAIRKEANLDPPPLNQ